MLTRTMLESCYETKVLDAVEKAYDGFHDNVEGDMLVALTSFTKQELLKNLHHQLLWLLM
jgi:hypothetical protein